MLHLGDKYESDFVFITSVYKMVGRAQAQFYI